MAQIDSNATKEQLAQMEREFARKRASAARRRAAELARLSEERAVVDGQGTSWAYVVVDGSFVRIISCDTAEESLAVPDELAGLPVKEVGPESFSHLVDTREILLPGGVEEIGAYAFRGCERLTRLVLPDKTRTFSSNWVSKCPSLDELVLPGALETVPADVLVGTQVRTLVVGEGTRAIAAGAFEKSSLASIRVDARNRHLKTDGICIYTADGCELVALARRVERYDVLPGCRIVGRKAFAGAQALAQVTLPEGLEVIDEFAFANSAIESIECPASLVEIRAKACMRCGSLVRVCLNEGLRSVGDEVFSSSALESLRVPATVEHIGRSITRKSNVEYSGAGATFVVDADNPRYFVDERGCLYRNEADGVHLDQMLEPRASAYEVDPAAVAVDDKAFAYHDSIERVVLPEGLERVGEGAFRVCRKLRCVSVPDSLCSVGADAFIDTEIESFRIPAGLVDIGRNALVTNGSHHEGPPPALRTIDVDDDNPVFFMHSGLLCRRVQSDVNVVMFTCSSEKVDFPEEVVEVEDYALNNAFGIRELHLNARLRTIGACGLSVMSQIRHVQIDVAQPVEGLTSFVLHFPATTHSVHGFLLALGGMGHLYLPDIMAQYDNCIASARDYHAPGKSENASAYEQVKLIIDRLNDSVLLTEPGMRRYRALVKDNIDEICVDISRHDDREAIRELADLGLLNESNLDGVIAAVNKLQDAAMTGYLLEMKRVRFSGHAVDFDL